MNGLAGVTLRRPAPEDAAELALMVNELSRHEGEPTGRFTPERALIDVIAEGAPVSGLIAETVGGLVGYALWHFAYESSWAERGAFLCDLYVRAPARGRGVGDALLRAVARAVADAGGTYLWWTAYERNEAARAFYRARAAEETGLRIIAAADADFEALLKEG